MRNWAVDPIVRSMVTSIEHFASGADLVCDPFRQSVAERRAELSSLWGWTEVPSRPDLAPGS